MVILEEITTATANFFSWLIEHKKETPAKTPIIDLRPHNQIAYETVITDFSDNDNKITTSKPLLNNEIFNQFYL